MKTYVLTVSRYFPATHKRKGEETHFIEKILNTINDNCCGWKKLHTIRSNYSLWEKRINEILKGDAILSIRYWSGKPYNSKQVEICQLDKDSGIGIQEVIFPFPNLHCFKINGVEFMTAAISRNDGLEYDDFKEWFKKHDFTKSMAIINFTNFRY